MLADSPAGSVAPDKIDFRAVTADDYLLLRRWLTANHMRQWWGEPETELGLIREMVEGRDTTRPFLILMDNRPVGYIQYWFIGDHQNGTWTGEHPWLMELPRESVGIDLSLGEENLLGCGIGTRALPLMAETLVTEGFQTLIIDPEATNARAIRCYEKAGFCPLKELAGRSGDTLIMKYDPSKGTLEQTDEYRT